ncbi:MAG TPA: hypothetical protein VIF60_12625, partial [Burkholderiaceae bacterium]
QNDLPQEVKMNPTLPPRRSLLLSTGSGDRRRGKVYERLAHKNSDTPALFRIKLCKSFAEEILTISPHSFRRPAGYSRREEIVTKET